MTTPGIFHNVQPAISQASEEIKKKGQLVTGHIVENLKQASGFAQTHVKTAYTIAAAVLGIFIALGHALADKIEKEKTAKDYINGSLAFGGVVLAGNLILKYAMNFPASKMAIVAIVTTAIAVRNLITFDKIEKSDKEIKQTKIDNLVKVTTDKVKNDGQIILTQLKNAYDHTIKELENQLNLVNDGTKELLILKLADLKESLGAANSQLSQKTDELNGIKKNLEEATAQLGNFATIQQEVINKQIEIDQLNTELKDIKQNLVSAHNQLNNSNPNQQELVDKQTEIDQLNNELNDIKQNLVGAQNQLTDFNKIQQEVTDKQKEIDQLKTQLTAKKEKKTLFGRKPKKVEEAEKSLENIPNPANIVNEN
jgi:hypothetical protein